MLLKAKILAGLYGIAFILISSFLSYGATLTYTYDNLNRVIKVDYGSGITEEYTYDAAGNRLSLLVKVPDSAPPTGSITINSGAMYTNATSVTSTLSCDDGTGSGCAEMQFSNDNISWLTPEVYASTKTLTLTPGDGMKTVYVKFRDNAGNWSDAYSDTIMLDTTPPASTVTSPGNGAAIMASSFTIAGNASDTGSNVTKVEISTDGGSTWNLATGVTSWSYAWAIPSDGTYTIQSRATDDAGNIETPIAGIIIITSLRHPSTVATNGRQILVNGEPFAIKGIGYAPTTIGDDPETTHPYGDYFTSDYSALYDRDLPLLRQMGANTIRLWGWNNTADHLGFLDKAYNNGIDPIYVIVGFWINAGLDIDPSSPSNVREQLKADFREMVSMHKNHPAILMWSIGNELNADWMYGGNLVHLFSLINEKAEEAHAEEGDNYHPITTPLLDNNLMNTVATYDASVSALDVWGANVYRGNTFGTLFSDYKAVSQKPLAILEYGIDAYDDINKDEYEKIGIPYQSEYAKALWNEIKANSSICIGGSIMAYSDEWWKGKYSTDPECSDNDPAIHGTCGYVTSSHPDGYANEEWWGIMRTMDNGANPDIMEPRKVYYALKDIWAPSSFQVSGGAYNFPQTSTYRASFSMDVTGPSSPSGWLKYYYSRTRMNFVSTAITSVSDTGSTATIAGTGTVNGVSGYTFTATVTDGTPDTFGITIKKSDGSTYYSAGPGAISGGDLIISLL